MKFPNEISHKNNNSTVIQSSVEPTIVDWKEWESRNKKSGKIILGNKLGEIFNITEEKPYFPGDTNISDEQNSL